MQFLAFFKAINQTALPGRLGYAFQNKLLDSVTTSAGPYSAEDILFLCLAAGLTQAVNGSHCHGNLSCCVMLFLHEPTFDFTFVHVCIDTCFSTADTCLGLIMMLFGTLL